MQLMRVEFGDAYASKVLGRAEQDSPSDKQGGASDDEDDVEFNEFKEDFIQSGPHLVSNLDDR